MPLQDQKTPLVGIVMGSDSDLEKMAEAAKVLEEFEVPIRDNDLLCARSPERTLVWTEKIKAEGGKVIIAGAGRAAHLAGVIAAHTTLPVIGVPMMADRSTALTHYMQQFKCPQAILLERWQSDLVVPGNAGLFAVQIWRPNP